MKLIIGADIALSRTEREQCKKGNIKISPCFSEMAKGGVSIFNLETPITEDPRPSQKFGTSLYAGREIIPLIKESGAASVSIANNHIMDCGDKGLSDTVANLKEAGITPFGYYDESGDHSFFEYEGGAVYSFCDTEYTKGEKSGAETYDEFTTLDKIKELADKYGDLTVLYHGGREYYEYPTPYLQRLCRRICDKGASLVICQHSHCIGSYERYNGSVIVYGQGNFRFYFGSISDKSLLIEKNEKDISFIPVINGAEKTEKAQGAAADEILSGFEERSRLLLNENFVSEKFDEYIKKNAPAYLRMLSGAGKLKTKLKFVPYNEKTAARCHNIMICNAHREIAVSALEKRIFDKTED